MLKLYLFSKLLKVSKCWWSSNKYHDLLNEVENEKTNFKLKEINEDYTSQLISSKIKEIHKSKNFFQFENQKVYPLNLIGG